MRAKIILPNFLAVLILGLTSFFYLRYDLERKAEDALRSRMNTVGTLFARSESLRGHEVLNEVGRQAMSRDILKAFAQLDVPSDDAAAPENADTAAGIQPEFKKCAAAIQEYLNKSGNKKPDFVALTDRAGVAVARNITPNACPSGYNLASGMPVVARALDGESAYGVWSVEDSPFRSKNPDKTFCQIINVGLLELAAAPIWIGEDIVGALVLGFEMSNGAANAHAKVMNLDVAVVKGAEVYSSSLTTDTARSSLERQLADAGVSKKVSEALSSGNLSEFFEISIEGEPFVAQVVPMAISDEKSGVYTVLMGSVFKEKRGLRSLGGILVLTAICLLLVFVFGMILAGHFLKPVMEIEEGILKVINGEYTYRFDVKSSEVGGLSYRINQMIGVLTGEEEDSSDEE